MASMNSGGYGLTGVASTDLGLNGLGDDLNQQLQAELKKRKQKAAQALTNPQAGSAAAMLGLGQ
jgi:hypothetical protein